MVRRPGVGDTDARNAQAGDSPQGKVHPVQCLRGGQQATLLKVVCLTAPEAAVGVSVKHSAEGCAGCEPASAKVSSDEFAALRIPHQKAHTQRKVTSFLAGEYMNELYGSLMYTGGNGIDSRSVSKSAGWNSGAASWGAPTR